MDIYQSHKRQLTGWSAGHPICRSCLIQTTRGLQPLVPTKPTTIVKYRCPQCNTAVDYTLALRMPLLEHSEKARMFVLPCPMAAWKKTARILLPGQSVNQVGARSRLSSKFGVCHQFDMSDFIRTPSTLFGDAVFFVPLYQVA